MDTQDLGLWVKIGTGIVAVATFIMGVCVKILSNIFTTRKACEKIHGNLVDLVDSKLTHVVEKIDEVAQVTEQQETHRIKSDKVIMVLWAKLQLSRDDLPDL